MKFDFFGILILAILIISIGIIFKIYVDTQSIKRKGSFDYLQLQKLLNIALSKCSKNDEKELMVNKLNASMIKRFFEITKRLISIQKFIFDEHF